MAFPGMTPTNPFALPETLRNPTSLATDRPLPPPGRSLDGTADLHAAISGHYPAKLDIWTILPTGTITEGHVWTYTFTPTKQANGYPLADGLAAISVDVTVDATATPTSLSDDAVVAIKNASKVTTFEGVDSFVRLSEILGEVSADSGTLTVKSRAPGQTFTPTVTPGEGDGSTITHTQDAAAADLRVGIFVVNTGTYASDGRTPGIAAPSANSTAADLLGIVADGDRVDAVSDDYTYHAYKSGRDVPIFKDGTRTVYSEAAVSAGARVWIRKTATGSEVAGAVNDEPEWTAQLLTVTPTAVDDTIYQGFVTVFDMRGTVNPVGTQVAQ